MRMPLSQLDSLKNQADWRLTICSKPQLTAQGQTLLTEASLFARQISDQLPEVGESQLPVLTQRAHELLDHLGIVLPGDHREETMNVTGLL